VKKACIYFSGLFLLLSAIFPGGVNELRKLPVLIQHYAEHRTAAKDNLGFWEFLAMHYDDQSNHRAENKHDELPLCNHSTHAVQYAITDIYEVVNALHLSQCIELVSDIPNHYCLLLRQTIFQPPRLG
jgi:hypothetical protein